MRTLEEGLVVAMTQIRARTDTEHPKHLTTICMALIGMLDAIAQTERWGKERQERRVREMLPSMRGLLDELWKDTK